MLKYCATAFRYVNTKSRRNALESRFAEKRYPHTGRLIALANRWRGIVTKIAKEIGLLTSHVVQ